MSLGHSALFLLFGKSWLAEPIAPADAGGLFLWLFATMVWSAFGALKVADKIADILGEPLGSLVLTLTIIGLEGVLIAIAILTSEAGATIGRDTLLGQHDHDHFAGGRRPLVDCTTASRRTTSIDRGAKYSRRLARS